MNLEIRKFYKIKGKYLIFIATFFCIGYFYNNYFYKNGSPRYVSTFMVKIGYESLFSTKQSLLITPVEDVTALIFRVQKFDSYPERVKKECSYDTNKSFLNSIQVLQVKNNVDLIKIKISGDADLNIRECSLAIFQYIRDSEWDMVKDQFLYAESIVKENSELIKQNIKQIENQNFSDARSIPIAEYIRELREESSQNKRILNLLHLKRASLISNPLIELEPIVYSKNIVSVMVGIFSGILGLLIAIILEIKFNFLRRVK